MHKYTSFKNIIRIILDYSSHLINFLSIFLFLVPVLALLIPLSLSAFFSTSNLDFFVLQNNSYIWTINYYPLAGREFIFDKYPSNYSYEEEKVISYKMM